MKKIILLTSLSMVWAVASMEHTDSAPVSDASGYEQNTLPLKKRKLITSSSTTHAAQPSSHGSTVSSNQTTTGKRKLAESSASSSVITASSSTDDLATIRHLVQHFPTLIHAIQERFDTQFQKITDMVSTLGSRVGTLETNLATLHNNSIIANQSHVLEPEDSEQSLMRVESYSSSSQSSAPTHSPQNASQVQTVDLTLDSDTEENSDGTIHASAPELTIPPYPSYQGNIRTQHTLSFAKPIKIDQHRPVKTMPLYKLYAIRWQVLSNHDMHILDEMSDEQLRKVIPSLIDQRLYQKAIIYLLRLLSLGTNHAGFAAEKLLEMIQANTMFMLSSSAATLAQDCFKHAENKSKAARIILGTMYLQEQWFKLDKDHQEILTFTKDGTTIISDTYAYICALYATCVNKGYMLDKGLQNYGKQAAKNYFNLFIKTTATLNPSIFQEVPLLGCSTIEGVRQKLTNLLEQA